MKKYFFVFLLLFVASVVSAKIKLPQLMGDHMVLQQESKARIWGESSPGIKISIRMSWNKEVIETQSDAKGAWLLEIPTPTASFDVQTIQIADGEGDIVELCDILIGEVWFASGQSNMEMPLNGYWNSPVEHSNEIIADATNRPAIRFVTIEKKGSSIPQKNANGMWKVSTPDNAPEFSAVAYHYALGLQNTLNVPVGIISCAYGGSRVEGWLPEEIVATFPDEDLTKVYPENQEYFKPIIMYNAMLLPCINYTIRGFLWYQGCCNVDSYKTYAERQSIMVKHWRELWKEGEIPFYYVEILPFKGYQMDGEKSRSAFFREEQFKSKALIPNSGIVCTNDLLKPEEGKQIHPSRKKEIGDRLAYQALNKTYGFKTIACESPSYRKMKIEGDKVELWFDNAPEGFSPWEGIVGFEVAGTDRVFHLANASVNQDAKTIIVTSKRVKKPVAVRYGFRNCLVGNLCNHRNLPVFPFRTDNWPLTEKD